ncbi:hypothetical protein, partial [Mycobacterium arosiense]
GIRKITELTATQNVITNELERNEELAIKNKNVETREAALALGLAGSAPLTGEIAKQLGIQDFQLDTEGTGNSTSVVASGNITDKLS